MNECVACWCDITESEPETICYYYSGTDRQTSQYCWICAVCQVSEFFERWQHSVDEADCASALRRLIAQGPPMTYADVDKSLHFESDARLVRGDGIFSRSAHLDGAPNSDQERDIMWNKLRERENELPENLEESEKEDVFKLKV